MTSAKKFKEIALGILTGVTLWIIGLLLAGRWSYIRDIVLYDTGFLIFAFPILFFAAFIWLAKYTAKNRTRAYYISSVVMFFVPIISWGIATYFSSSLLDRSGTIEMIFRGISAPAASVFVQVFENITYTNEFAAEYIMATLISIVPVLAGLVCSVILYRKAIAARS